jgi:hypothetical protein
VLDHPRQAPFVPSITITPLLRTATGDAACGDAALAPRTLVSAVIARQR